MVGVWREVRVGRWTGGSVGVLTWVRSQVYTGSLVATHLGFTNTLIFCIIRVISAHRLTLFTHSMENTVH